MKVSFESHTFKIFQRSCLIVFSDLCLCNYICMKYLYDIDRIYIDNYTWSFRQGLLTSPSVCLSVRSAPAPCDLLPSTFGGVTSGGIHPGTLAPQCTEQNIAFPTHARLLDLRETNNQNPWSRLDAIWLQPNIWFTSSGGIHSCSKKVREFWGSKNYNSSLPHEYYLRTIARKK